MAEIDKESWCEGTGNRADNESEVGVEYNRKMREANEKRKKATGILKRKGINRTTKRVYSYSIYIYRVLKKIWPDKMRISKRSMSILNTFMNDIFEKLTLEASRLIRYKKQNTLYSRDLQTAVRLVLPGELAKHAVHEGTKAVTLWMPAIW